MFHLPGIHLPHSCGKKSIRYCLIKQLNAENGSITNMVHIESFLIYKVHIKSKVIDGYRDCCQIDNCYKTYFIVIISVKHINKIILFRCCDTML